MRKYNSSLLAILTINHVGSLKYTDYTKEFMTKLYGTYWIHEINKYEYFYTFINAAILVI